MHELQSPFQAICEHCQKPLGSHATRCPFRSGTYTKFHPELAPNEKRDNLDQFSDPLRPVERYIKSIEAKGVQLEAKRVLSAERYQAFQQKESYEARERALLDKRAEELAADPGQLVQLSLSAVRKLAEIAERLAQAETSDKREVLMHAFEMHAGLSEKLRTLLAVPTVTKEAILDSQILPLAIQAGFEKRSEPAKPFLARARRMVASGKRQYLLGEQVKVDEGRLAAFKHHTQPAIQTYREADQALRRAEMSLEPVALQSELDEAWDDTEREIEEHAVLLGRLPEVRRGCEQRAEQMWDPEREESVPRILKELTAVMKGVEETEGLPEDTLEQRAKKYAARTFLQSERNTWLSALERMIAVSDQAEELVQDVQAFQEKYGKNAVSQEVSHEVLMITREKELRQNAISSSSFDGDNARTEEEKLRLWSAWTIAKLAYIDDPRLIGLRSFPTDEGILKAIDPVLAALKRDLFKAKKHYAEIEVDRRFWSHGKSPKELLEVAKLTARLYPARKRMVELDEKYQLMKKASRCMSMDEQGYQPIYLAQESANIGKGFFPHSKVSVLINAFGLAEYIERPELDPAHFRLNGYETVLHPQTVQRAFEKHLAKKEYAAAAQLRAGENKLAYPNWATEEDVEATERKERGNVFEFPQLVKSVMMLYTLAGNNGYRWLVDASEFVQLRDTVGQLEMLLKEKIREHVEHAMTENVKAMLGRELEGLDISYRAIALSVERVRRERGLEVAPSEREKLEHLQHAWNKVVDMPLADALKAISSEDEAVDWRQCQGYLEKYGDLVMWAIEDQLLDQHPGLSIATIRRYVEKLAFECRAH